ncbi:hypothetical protein DOTSEDRAFT_119511 [Lecanosticta acicola]|uniref:Protein ZIP4 homolog n=1 Tax=Lecanosticta acicola TaxID=111012 RepID=A0AAI8YUK7_9PEZI|nr:hypothetical protein DOTSEDRAFT_119511 [Lecanosticta acicola]
MAGLSLDDEAADLAQRTLEVLRDRRKLPANLQTELRKQITRLTTTNSIANSRAYEHLGTELWNSVAAPLQEEGSDRRWGASVRLFAFLLLETVHRLRRNKKGDQTCRVLKIGLRTARLCLEVEDVDLAVTTFERVALYADTASDAPLMQISHTEDNRRTELERVLHALTGEYHLLRLMCEWKRNRLDLTELWYKKINLTKPAADLHLKAADLFLEIGNSLSVHRKGNQAIQWFDRAFAALTECDLETQEHASYQERAELFLSVGIAYVDELSKSSNPSNWHRACEVVGHLERTQELRTRIAVPIAKIKVLALNNPDDVDEITAALSRITKLSVLTDSNFKIVMQTFHKASAVSLPSTLTVLRSFIVSRLLPGLDDTRVWLEKATVAYILFMIPKTPGSPDAPSSDLKALLDSIASSTNLRFSARATHAIQALFWKAGWDSLLRHTLLENSGPINKARIGRRLIQNALNKDQLDAAREAFFDMPSAARKEPVSRYLAFKLALRLNDEDLALSSLAVVTKAARSDPTHLYACLLAATESESRRFAVAALEALLDQRPNGVYLPSLLRCTARLLIKEVGSEGRDANEVAEQLLQVFEVAAKNTEEIRQLPNDKWRAEVQWWSKNAYNLAIKLCAHVHPEYILRMLDVCTRFLDCHPDDIGLMQQDGLEKRRMMCSFLSTTALIVLGRTVEDSPDYTTQCFLHAQQRISSFKTLYAKLSESVQDPKSQERAFSMLKFEIECILRLRQWDKLNAALQACINVPHVSRWDTLADLIILVHGELDETTQDSHADMIRQLLQRIINDTWKKEREIKNVARWVRFAFTLCLESHNGNASDFSLRLLQQAAGMAENGCKGKHDPYPETELQWLATMGFNHAVDLLMEGGDDVMAWMDGALQLAKWSDDNGSLHGMLTRQKGMVLERMSVASQAV